MFRYSFLPFGLSLTKFKYRIGDIAWSENQYSHTLRLPMHIYLSKLFSRISSPSEISLQGTWSLQVGYIWCKAQGFNTVVSDVGTFGKC